MPAYRSKTFSFTLRLVRVSLSYLVLLVPMCMHAQQQSATCTDWTNVTSWGGTITVSGSGGFPDRDGGSISIQENATIAFKTDQRDGGCDPGAPPISFAWTASSSKTTYSVDIHDADTMAFCGVFQLGFDEFEPEHADITNGSAGIEGTAQLDLTFSDQTKGTYIVAFAPHVNNVLFSTDGNGQDCKPASFTESLSWGPVTQSGSLFSDPVPLPSVVSPLTGNITLQAPGGVFGAISGSTATWTISWNLTPNPPNPDLVITIPEYDTWRPAGGRTETDTGFDPDTNSTGLEIKAALKDKDTGADLIPDKFTFLLASVSHEPGVAMNWPSAASDNPAADMSFDARFNPSPATVEDDGATLVFDKPEGAGALAFLSPHDWGGWATLNVTAMVAGRTVQGHLEGQTDTDILLPKRQPNSFVADSWKRAHGIALDTPDNDDTEDDPHGENGTGDGFTLYEEYRGFYMGCSNNSALPQPEGSAGASCQHAEGDPSTKDFFVVNLIQEPAIEGVELFGFGSGLNVHHRGLNLDEVGPQGGPSYRVINLNHSIGPHEVDQHAVVLDWGPPGLAASHTSGFGVSCPSITGQCGALPKHADRLEIAPALGKPPFGNQPFAENSYSVLATDVAHELTHSVDGYHHGDQIDHTELWSWDPIADQVVLNLPDGSTSPIHVTTEDQLSGGLLVFVPPAVLGLVDEDEKGNPIPSLPQATRVANRICNGQVVTHGESSGDVLDFMRYESSQAYIPAGGFSSDIRVLASDVTTGVDLTDHPGGTGVNDPNRKPISRYGDADTDHRRGDDRLQVDVNDSHSEIIRGEFSCPSGH